MTLSETELQLLQPGEFYDVPPAVGRVLVSEGWAVAPETDAQGRVREPAEVAHDDASDRSTS